MGKIVRATGRRLKGLDELEKPAFVGRMPRIERRRQMIRWAVLGLTVAIGAAIGWILF